MHPRGRAPAIGLSVCCSACFQSLCLDQVFQASSASVVLSPTCEMIYLNSLFRPSLIRTPWDQGSFRKIQITEVCIDQCRSLKGTHEYHYECMNNIMSGVRICESSD